MLRVAPDLGIGSAGGAASRLVSGLKPIASLQPVHRLYCAGREVEISVRSVLPTPKNFEDAITGMLPYVDILVVWSTLGAVAARNVRTIVPTVFLSVGAPVNIGIVQSLARPGGNMTGVTFEAATETYGKRLQIL